MRFLCFVGLCALVLVSCDRDFPPPRMPKMPPHFNIFCDVCTTLLNRVVPYCEREEQNNDYLPDFCVFNYNQVLRTECDYLVDVMEYAWCPSACEKVRQLKSFAAGMICRHPLVNCTDRDFHPTPSPSPSPSPSSPIPPDCVLCQYILKQVSQMCMNSDRLDKTSVYHMCMSKTNNHLEFEHCEHFLEELVAIANTTDTCKLLSCSDPRVSCAQKTPEEGCHVVEYTGGVPPEFSDFGLDASGNFAAPETSAFAKTTGLGPGDLKPGPKPFHSALPNRIHLPPHVRVAGHAFGDEAPVMTTPANDEELKQAEIDANIKALSDNIAIAAQPQPEPITLKDVQMN
eukprot:c25413_g1_i1.p1 GENE.c25413_g1_i1~~c25413_g1_i1.p1  ORF type:complete len:343 (+),score=58.35 c25413_g1_i1:38-1066(+)